jgi:hypothetical protein
MKIQVRAMAACAALAALAARGCTPRGPTAASADVTEYPIAWPDRGEPPRNNCDPRPGETVHAGSTHEIAFDWRRPGCGYRARITTGWRG